MSKLTDYGTVVLAELARCRAGYISAAEMAQVTGLGLPTVSKLLNTLARAELVVSTRGSHGGYRLSRDPKHISAADVIDASGAADQCVERSASASPCGVKGMSSVGIACERMNVAIRRALDEISLADLLRALSPTPRFQFAGTPINIERES